MAIANADSRAELQRLVDEQAALRRVAPLAARGAEPVEVFSAVAAEVGRFLDADLTWMVRFEADGTGTVIASAGPTNIPAGSRWKLEPKFGMATVARTGRPARIDDYSGATVGLPDAVRREGLKSAVACPIFVEGRLWGTIGAGSTGGPLPPDAERRTAAFTELLGTAIANAESHAELTASRARIVAASDEARRRIERDLHDGAQQRLVALTLDLRAVQTLLPADGEIRVELARVEKRLADAQDELQEISRGIHPAILSESGLGPALKTLARRSPVPVALDVHVPERLPEQIEVAAYYVVSEMLTNTAKHANASEIDIGVESHDAGLSVSVRDDGDGGADPAGGSGLTGLRDRAEALGGTISLQSPPGGGTALTVELPLNARHIKSVAGHEAQPAPRDH
jgi:signal transduction histidine kinase